MLVKTTITKIPPEQLDDHGDMLVIELEYSPVHKIVIDVYNEDTVRWHIVGDTTYSARLRNQWAVEEISGREG